MMIPHLPSPDCWAKFNHRKNPFLRFEFMNALFESGSIGESAGWLPVHFSLSDGSFLYSFLKGHSYGEFIFDWSWAESYERYGIPYYPKLTSMVPFSPVSTNHFLTENESPEIKRKLLEAHDQFLAKSSVSGAHFLFVPQEDLGIYREPGYLERHSLQYHFENPGYTDFQDFLLSLKTKKAKNIRKEREFPAIEFKRYTGGHLTQEHAERMYEYYLLTIEGKNSYAYLQRDFFKLAFQSMGDQILFIEAYKDGTPIAGSLFFFSPEKLYGRYWGSKIFVENLHFELCYYQGIDFCLERKLSVFEAGAQGVHKIARGFRPTIIYSAHKLANSAFHAAIGNFIQREKQVIEKNTRDLSQLLPFKDKN